MYGVGTILTNSTLAHSRKSGVTLLELQCLVPLLLHNILFWFQYAGYTYLAGYSWGYIQGRFTVLIGGEKT